MIKFLHANYDFLPSVKPKYAQLSKIMAISMLGSHIGASIFYLIAKLEDYPNSWTYGREIQDRHHFRQYTDAQYWAF